MAVETAGVVFRVKSQQKLCLLSQQLNREGATGEGRTGDGTDVASESDAGMAGCHVPKGCPPIGGLRRKTVV
jgi:hypothetical protein